MQLGQPAFQWRFVGLFPEVRNQCAQQKLLGEAHARMWWHFKAAEFNQTETSGRAVGREELIDTEFRTMSIAG